jgi:hypothetical protein
MMLKALDADAVELTLSLSQLKKLYVALFRQLHASRLRDLDQIDEDDMLLTFQTYLQKRAAGAGVDGTIHSEWERFLGIQEPPTCEQRAQRGRVRPER